MIKKIVVDASVAVKWFCSQKEQNTEKAIYIFEKAANGSIEIIVPDIFLYELGNVFIRAKELKIVDIKENFEILSELGIKTIPLNKDLIIKISALAVKTKLTFYDSAYLAIANEFNIDLITEDRRILKTKLLRIKSLATF